MNQTQVLQAVLEERTSSFLNLDQDKFGRSIMKIGARTLLKPTEWRTYYDFSRLPFGIYSHTPPPGELDIVICKPNGQYERTAMKCETVYEKFSKTKTKQTFQGCKTVEAFMTKWKGSNALNLYILDYLKRDAATFGVAFEKAINVPQWSLKPEFLRNIPAYYQYRIVPELTVKLTFPLPRELPGEKLLMYIGVKK